MAKKAQGMSINTIIIAILVLIVLVVLVMVFSGYFGGWTRNVASCQSQGGSCAGDSSMTRSAYTCQYSGASDKQSGVVTALTGRCDVNKVYDQDLVCCPPGAVPVAKG
jgi:hypothetical protein